MSKPLDSDSMRPYEVFVSHASADKWLATVVCEKIEKETGATTFRDDRDIDGGEDIPDRIRKEIQRSREIVVLLTPYSVNRPWVLLEVGAAWGRRKSYEIVPILCHAEVDAIPELIKKKKAININQFPEYLTELKKRVKQHAGKIKSAH